MGQEKKVGKPVFILVGRLGKSLVYSKVAPIKRCFKDCQVYIFREKEGFEIPGCQYICLPRWTEKIRGKVFRRILRNIIEPLQIIRFATKFKPQLIVGVSIVPKGYYTLIASWFGRSKSLINIIGNVVEIETYLPLSKFWKKLNIRTLKKVGAIATKGEKVNQYLVDNGINPNKIFTYNGFIDTTVFNQKETKLKPIDILFVGTFRPLKGPDRVLEIVRRLSIKIPGIKAAFLGDGEMLTGIKEMAKNYELIKNFTFPGSVEHPEEYFKKSKILLMPSVSEGLPTAMLEAMACLCVPVISDVGNISDAAYHGENSYLVPDFNDLNSFSSYAYELLTNADLRQKMAKLGYRTVIEKYTIDKQTEAFNKLREFLKLSMTEISEPKIIHKPS